MGRYGYIRLFPDSRSLAAAYRLGSFPPALAETIASFMLSPRVVNGPAASSRHGSASGCVVELPVTTQRIGGMQPARILRNITVGARLARKRGALIAGTALAGELVRGRAVDLAREAGIPVVTGRGYALTVAVRAIDMAARLVGVDLRTARVAVTGLPSPEGEVCARLLARSCSRLTLAGRPGHALNALAVSIMESTGLSPRIVSRADGQVPESDVIVAAPGADLRAGGVRPGGVVCDLGHPPAEADAMVGTGVLVIDGGLVRIPRDAAERSEGAAGERPGDDLCTPSLAAAMMLAMEGFTSAEEVARLEGPVPSAAEADEMNRIALRHGFLAAGPAWRGRLIGPTDGGSFA